MRVVSFLLSCGARRDATLKLSVSAMRSNAGGSGAFHAAAQVSACAQPTPSVLSPTSEWMRTAVLTGASNADGIDRGYHGARSG